jgi:prepilin-type N-terminal cleavage/methylation domain-containing protein
MIKKRFLGNHGFSLVELLIVVGMLGGVMAAVYSVYTVHQRSAYTQDEVVEVQQNLRIGLDEMTRDIKSAGLLIPAGSTAIGGFANNTGLGNTDSITINTASASGRYALIAQNVAAGGVVSFPVNSTTDVDKFVNTDPNVIIIRPSDKSQLSPGVITGATSGTAVLTIATSATPSGGYYRGDMIVGTTGAIRPDTIQYCVGPSATCGPGVTTCPLGQNCLMRIENGTANLIATNITDLQFRYLLQDLTEVDAPPDLSLVRAVRVSLSGQTASTKVLTVGTRQRQLTSVVRVRNTY